MKKVWLLLIKNEDNKRVIYIPFGCMDEFMHGMGIEGWKQVEILELIEIKETPAEWFV